MTASSDREARTSRLIHARRSSAQRKQQQAMDTVRSLEDAGTPITVTVVARAAHVSTWFVYNNITVRAAVDTATRRQAATAPENPCGRLADDRTLQGIRVDLAGARDEIRALRDERAQLRRRLEQSLGRQVDQVATADLAAQMQDLTMQRSAMIDELTAARAQVVRSIEEIAALQDELTGVRAALRRMMRRASVASPSGRVAEAAAGPEFGHA